MKIGKIALILFIVGFIAIILFLVKYQWLVNEGSVLADEHCIKVNPLIIARKNNYSSVAKLIEASASGELFWPAEEKYIAANRRYIAAEENWLNKQNAFLNKWEFRLLPPYEIRRIGDLQYQITTQELKMAKITVGMYDNLDDVAKQGKFIQEAATAAEKRKELLAEYDKILSRKPSFDDPRYLITKVPPSKCPPQNLQIPEVPDIFAPKTPDVPAPSDINIFSLS